MPGPVVKLRWEHHEKKRQELANELINCIDAEQQRKKSKAPPPPQSYSPRKVQAAVCMQSHWRGKVARDDFYWDTMGYGLDEEADAF